MQAEIGAHQLAKRLFGASGGGAVVVGQIEMGDAMVKRGATDCLLGGMGGVVAKVVPKAKADRRQHQARPAAPAIGHPVVTIFAGGVGHDDAPSGDIFSRATVGFKLHGAWFSAMIKG